MDRWDFSTMQMGELRRFTALECTLARSRLNRWRVQHRALRWKIHSVRWPDGSLSVHRSR